MRSAWATGRFCCANVSAAPGVTQATASADWTVVPCKLGVPVQVAPVPTQRLFASAFHLLGDQKQVDKLRQGHSVGYRPALCLPLLGRLRCHESPLLATFVQNRVSVTTQKLVSVTESKKRHADPMSV